jgi:hypothetical protein
MACIYNETMLKLYARGELYKSKRSSMGKCGFWSKNCSYGYAHYNPETNEFAETLGWEGMERLNKRFSKKGTPPVFEQNNEHDKQLYFDFLKHYKKEHTWIYTIYGTELRRFYKQISPYIMLIKI